MQLENEMDNTDNNTLLKAGYAFSWVFLLFAIIILLAGCYFTFKGLSAKKAVNIELDIHKFSPSRQQEIADKIRPTIHGNFFTIDIANIEQQVSELNWVKSVKVERKWPNSIAISLLPRQAIAKYGSERMLSGDGIVFKGDGLVKKNETLPQLYGPVDKTIIMMEQYHQLNKWFKNSHIKITELSLSDQMTWFLKFDNGLRVIVDKEKSQKKLFHLSVVLEKQLKPFMKRINYIDLRYKNGMAVSWQNGMPANFATYVSSVK